MTEMVEVKVSSKWARHLFACSEDYISICRGRCCQGTDRILVSVTPEEAVTQVLLGKTVVDGLLQPDPDTGRCPWKRETGFCGLHGTRDKPLGCVISPFKVNASGTVIIRHRYTQMRCHGHGQPAYLVFNASLVAMFGVAEAGRITSLLDCGSGDVDASMSEATSDALHYLEELKGT